MLLSFDEVLVLMDAIADEFPPAFTHELNGAVLLLPETNVHPDDPALFTMGCYCRDALGRRIELYYGSFAALAETEDWTREDWADELRETLAHEFTHHLEGLAGERGLEVKDELFMEAYHAQKEGPPVEKPKKFRFLPKRSRDN